ncbi:MAG: hypothetical protein NC178_02615, partial [Bacteroides sp.]|nr:hypothetical protein [Bacteroides sp.]
KKSILHEADEQLDYDEYSIGEIDIPIIRPSHTPEAEEADRLDELAIEAEKKRWVDALTTLVMGYVSRFHEMPPINMIEEKIKGRIAINNFATSDIVVSGDMKIYLPDYNELEIRMTPLARTVYILFLMHPEGIVLNNIDEYRDQLVEIYSMVKNITNEENALRSIADLACPASESLQQKLSMIRRALRRQIIPTSLADRYSIRGERGGLYRIEIADTKIHLPHILRQ